MFVGSRIADAAMKKDNTSNNTKTTDRLAALEQAVGISFRNACKALSGNLQLWTLQDELRRLQEQARQERDAIFSVGRSQERARTHYDEVRTLADEISILRARSGTAPESFRQAFELVKDRLNGNDLACAAIRVRGVIDGPFRPLHCFVLHLLITPGLIDASRRVGTEKHSWSESIRDGGMDGLAGQDPPGFWPRVAPMLDAVEELGRDFNAEQLRTLLQLEIAEARFEELVANYSKEHEGKPWIDWPTIWSKERQERLAAEALERFAQAFLDAKCHEDLNPGELGVTHAVIATCRRYEQAVAQLTIARLEARVDALEARLAAGPPVRPAKAASRAKKSAPMVRRRDSK